MQKRRINGDDCHSCFLILQLFEEHNKTEKLRELIWRGGVTVGTTSPPCMMTRPFKKTSSGMPFVADTCS